MSTGKLVAVVLSLCGVAGLLLIAICGGLFYSGFRNADVSISPKIDAVFAAMAAGETANAYANDTTTEFRKVVTEEQFVALGKAIDSRLGKLKSKSLRGYRWKQHNTGSYVDVTYAAVFENGGGTISSTLKKQGSEWKFVGLNVNSPLFERDMATRECPSCGKPHSLSAKFCPSCGASLTEAPGEGSSKKE